MRTIAAGTVDVTTDDSAAAGKELAANNCCRESGGRNAALNPPLDSSFGRSTSRPAARLARPRRDPGAASRSSPSRILERPTYWPRPWAWQSFWRPRIRSRVRSRRLNRRHIVYWLGLGLGLSSRRRLIVLASGDAVGESMPQTIEVGRGNIPPNAPTSSAVSINSHRRALSAGRAALLGESLCEAINLIRFVLGPRPFVRRSALPRWVSWRSSSGVGDGKLPPKVFCGNAPEAWPQV